MQSLQRSTVKGLELSGVLQQVTPKPVGDEISVYAGYLTQPAVTQQSGRIRQVFPQLSAGWHGEFLHAIRRHGFTDQRLLDAVNHVIDHCRYPQPTVADFVSFDQSVKFRSYDWMVRNSNETVSMWDHYTQVRIGNATVYISNSDAARHPHLLQEVKYAG